MVIRFKTCILILCQLIQDLDMRPFIQEYPDYIVGNEWFSRTLGEEMYCTDDASVSTLGDGTKEEGEMSPKNLLTTTTDELRMGTNFKGKSLV
jgi:hypothetical protein